MKKAADKAADDAAKAIKKATNEKASADTEAARLKARPRTAASRQAENRRKQQAYHKKIVDGDPTDFITGTGTQDDVCKALVRYHGSSASAMLLEVDDIKKI